jgi:putative peptide zinc metalloprotease protein
MSATLSAATPRLRTDVVLGRALRRGDETVHYLKDPHRSEYYRVGAKEFFVIERLDGQRSLADIGEDYQRRFQARLADQHWVQILALLGRRSLLVGAPESTGSGAVPRPRSRRTLLRRTFPMVNPDTVLTALTPRLGPLLRPGAVAAMLLAVLCLDAVVVTHLGQLAHDARHGPAWWVRVPLVVLIGWLILALHEVAHGVVCKRFGGDVPEIGVIWRFPFVAPYCRVDDVLVFPRRRQAVWTALAGVYAGQVALLPFGALWWLASPGSFVRGLAAAMLIFGTLSAASNLLPFLQLDGYSALNHALGTADLNRESYRFLRRVLTGRRTALRRYTRRDRWLYCGYGSACVLFWFALGAAWLWWLRVL